MAKLTDRQTRLLAKNGSLLIPKQISWRRAEGWVKAKLATIYPSPRWVGRLDFTDTARAALTKDT